MFLPQRNIYLDDVKTVEAEQTVAEGVRVEWSSSLRSQFIIN